MAKSIRPAGPSFTELPLDTLSAAETTLTDGYGHAADRAILIHALLEAAGFKPEFVLASDLPATDGIRKTVTSFPMAESYDTILVKVALDGVTYYLNDTDEYAQLGSTVHDDTSGNRSLDPGARGNRRREGLPGQDRDELHPLIRRRWRLADGHYQSLLWQ